MQEDDSYIANASITTLRMGFLTIWLSWKQECSKSSQVLLLKTWAKKELSGAERSKIVT